MFLIISIHRWPVLITAGLCYTLIALVTHSAKAQLALPRITEPGIVAMQANQAGQFNFEQAGAAASLGTSKQIFADSTNSQQRGEHKSYGGNSFKNKRKGAYGNRREHYDESYDSRYNGQIHHFSQRS